MGRTYHAQPFVPLRTLNKKLKYHWYSARFPPVVQRSKTRGKAQSMKSPDFGPLGIWQTKNTTKFSASFGGQKGAKTGGKNPKNTTDDASHSASEQNL